MNIPALSNKIAKEISKIEAKTNYSARFKSTEVRFMKEAGLTSIFQDPKKYFKILRQTKILTI